MPNVVRLAQAALAAPFAGFGDFEAYPTLGEKAAIYCSRIVTYHPLPDGNKRSGYDTMREFIDRNAATFTHAPGGLMADRRDNRKSRPRASSASKTSSTGSSTGSPGQPPGGCRCPVPGTQDSPRKREVRVRGLLGTDEEERLRRVPRAPALLYT